jgi:hypothetical protein
MKAAQADFNWIMWVIIATILGLGLFLIITHLNNFASP